MNHMVIIGNLTRDPETRTAGATDTVCTFTVAVNKRTGKDHPEADFFRVSAWNKLGELAQTYLAKGRKVCVTGPISVSSYQAKDGSGTRFTLELRADSIEFLSPRGEESKPREPGEDDEPPF